MDGVLDANFMREGAMVDADHDDSGRRLASGANTNGEQQRALHLLLEQVRVHSRPYNTFPDLAIKSVRAESTPWDRDTPLDPSASPRRRGWIEL